MSSISGFGPSASFDTASDLLETAEDEIAMVDEAIETQSERGAQIRESHPSMRYRNLTHIKGNFVAFISRLCIFVFTIIPPVLPRLYFCIIIFE